MFEVASDHNGATGARPSCLAEVSMASKAQGVVAITP